MAQINNDIEYSFGRFRLHSIRTILWNGDQQIQLTRKRHEILLFLVRNNGRSLSKEELLSALWPEKDVEESNLSNQIYTLRRILEEDPTNPQIIVTVPGVGYRFQEEVTILPAPSIEVTQTAPEPVDSGDLKKRGRWMAILGVGLVIVAILILAKTLQKAEESKWSYEGNLSIPITSYPGAESLPALSPNGQLLAFTWDGDRSNNDIYVKQIIGGEPIRLTSHPNEEFMATWSPDGQMIAFLRRADQVKDPLHLIVVPALGGMEREVARIRGGFDWAPDGRHLAVVNPVAPVAAAGINLIAIDGTNHRQLTNPDESDSFDSFPKFSPSGEYIAFTRWKSDANGDIYVIELKNGAVTQLTFDQAVIGNSSPQWTRNGKELCFLSNRGGSFQLWNIDPDGGSPQLTLPSNWPIDYYSISRNGNMIVYVPKINDTLIEISSNPAQPGDFKEIIPCVINSTQVEQGPRFSPDGSKIVYTSNQTGWQEIWIANSDCSGSRQVTSFREYGVGSPRWSPDGQGIVFDRRADGIPEIYTISADGTNLRQITWSLRANRPAWSTDGRSIFFTAPPVGSNKSEQIWRIPATGGEAIQITTSGGVEPVVSSDGKRLYYASGHYLYQKDLPAGIETPVPGMENIQIDRYWDVSDSAIYFIPFDSGDKPTIERLDLRTRRITRIRELTKQLIPWQLGISIFRDETRLAVSLVNHRIGDIMMIEGKQK